MAEGPTGGGAGRVIVVDHLAERLEKARTMAHAETLDYDELDDVVLELKEQTDFLGADVVIDAVGAEADGNFLQQVTGKKLKLQGGSPVALNWAIDGVRKGGTVSVVGRLRSDPERGEVETRTDASATADWRTGCCSSWGTGSTPGVRTCAPCPRVARTCRRRGCAAN
jgi:threonine dehydrogenase-like Zn-dependent dehydrogenase